MREVAIIGAGELGGAVAHILARRDLARAITLVDERGHVAEGKALDIAQAAPVEGFATQLSGSTDIAAATAAQIIVIADAFGGSEWAGDEGFQLLRRLTLTASSAVIICAGASQCDLVERAVRDLRFKRVRLFGSAPEGLVGGARALVALATNGSPRDVALSVLGRPPQHTVIPWADASVGGFSLARRLDEPTRRAIATRTNALWPPGPYALASAAVKAIATMVGRSRQTTSCFVAPDLSAGARVRASAMPVQLGPSGIVSVITPALSVVEKVALDNATEL